jgi:hypothetical protein
VRCSKHLNEQDEAEEQQEQQEWISAVESISLFEPNLGCLALPLGSFKHQESNFTAGNNIDE